MLKSLNQRPQVEPKLSISFTTINSNVDSFRKTERRYWNERSWKTQIETDRRIIKDKISLLKEIVKIDKQGFTQRQRREHLIRVSWIYNAGKSTLMNSLAVR